MSKTTKRTSSRLKIIRAAILSASLLSFVPLYSQIRPDQTVVEAETPAVISPVSVPSASIQPQTTAPSTQQRVPQSHARTRGS